MTGHLASVVDITLLLIGSQDILSIPEISKIPNTKNSKNKPQL